MINHRVDVEATFVRVFDLAHDFPNHVVVGLAWRRLNLAIDAKSHCFPPFSVWSDSRSPVRRPRAFPLCWRNHSPPPLSPDTSHERIATAHHRVPLHPRLQR